MNGSIDGPQSRLFRAVPIQGPHQFSHMDSEGVSQEMLQAAGRAPRGSCVCWGLPFLVGPVVYLRRAAVTVELGGYLDRWVVFMHTSDKRTPEHNDHGFISPMRGQGDLGNHAADYVLVYEDGTEHSIPIRRRHEIGMFTRMWGENCFAAVAHHKPLPVRPNHEQPAAAWGKSQTRADAGDSGPWVNWLFAAENPYLEKRVTHIRFEPADGGILVSGLATGNARHYPFRWESRRKALLSLPDGVPFRWELDADGLLAQIQLDMGQIISAQPAAIYPQSDWSSTYNNKLPDLRDDRVIIEYTAHPDAAFHLDTGEVIPVASLESTGKTGSLEVVKQASRRVRLRVVDGESGAVVPVKLHVHGESGEYLAPVDRHRIPNPAWFEDYSVDFSHQGRHSCTYIAGETVMDLPIGPVFIEVSRGFEIRPVRTVVEVRLETETLTVTVEKVLPWRERGWITADTHVHFLSPTSALLEGQAEGVNVVNLLASQWGELVTNVGDFDGKTTWGSREAGGDGEYLVRVGTENRQHVLGHISLLGYEGRMIAPVTTGGPDESAIGDPVGNLLTEWAVQCKRQNGLVVLPHFPNPRAENAATIVSGNVDGVEMTSWGDLYSGINPYSLSDWYRYLNCGYLVAAVGGTDKMSAATAVGTVRTYARVSRDAQFTYEAWKEAVQRGETFVSYGPLLEFTVAGKTMGSWVNLSASGATLDVSWEVASVTVPMSRVELVVNGEIRESTAVDAERDSGSWSLKVDRSSWAALLVRGHYPDKPEIVAAHSSPVMVAVEGSEFEAAADMLTILDQIEGALAYLDTVGTRAETARYKAMRLILESTHRDLHNRMHRLGHYHDHTPTTDHREHH